MIIITKTGLNKSILFQKILIAIKKRIVLIILLILALIAN